MNSKGCDKEVLRMLVLGPLPPPIGGTTVLLKTLVDDLARREDIQLRIINTGAIRKNGIRGAGKLIGTPFAIVIGATRVDVISAHLNDMPFAHLGLFTVLVGRLMGRPVVMRKFGGNPFRLGKVGSWMAYKVMRLANASLVETHALLREADAKRASNVQWYPNNRPIPVALYQAMELLSEDQELFARLCKGALLKSLDFDSRAWTEKFVNICRTLVSGRQIRPVGWFAHAR